MGSARSIISSVKSLLNPIQKSRGIQKKGGFLILAFVLAQLKSSDVTCSTFPSWLKPKDGVAWPYICIGASVSAFKFFPWKQSQTRPSNQHGLFIYLVDKSFDKLSDRVASLQMFYNNNNFVLGTFFANCLQIVVMCNFLNLVGPDKSLQNFQTLLCKFWNCCSRYAFGISDKLFWN